MDAFPAIPDPLSPYPPEKQAAQASKEKRSERKPEPSTNRITSKSGNISAVKITKPSKSTVSSKITKTSKIAKKSKKK